MASSIIHICVAKEINKNLKLDETMLYLGTIAPDLSKLCGETKLKSHFSDNDDYIPNIDKFIDKYGDNLFDPFIMGYFIHLCTDYLWFRYFITEFNDYNSITLLDGTVMEVDRDQFKKFIYSDYTDMNIKLIDKYELSLDLFFNEVTIPDFDFNEIDISKLQLLIDECGLIIANTKESKNYVFDITNVSQFIETSSKIIYSQIDEKEVI
ncbi:MAG: zinc dependent phospholipase C family protein [Bacilli bacterium]|nr:zinc dependent phospholipase C family protein [Bacilli bacterium]